MKDAIGSACLNHSISGTPDDEQNSSLRLLRWLEDFLRRELQKRFGPAQREKYLQLVSSIRCFAAWQCFIRVLKGCRRFVRICLVKHWSRKHCFDRKAMYFWAPYWAA